MHVGQSVQILVLIHSHILNTSLTVWFSRKLSLLFLICLIFSCKPKFSCWSSSYCLLASEMAISSSSLISWVLGVLYSKFDLFAAPFGAFSVGKRFPPSTFFLGVLLRRGFPPLLLVIFFLHLQFISTFQVLRFSWHFLPLGSVWGKALPRWLPWCWGSETLNKGSCWPAIKKLNRYHFEMF